jgi:multicomponent Na+:H+ antiporter subunit B
MKSRETHPQSTEQRADVGIERQSTIQATSLILCTVTSFVQPLLLLFSIFLLLRGHNEPGGGFTGGLVAAAAFALYAVAYDVASARRVLRVNPQTLVGAGLLLAVASGICSLFLKQPFMTGQWGKVKIMGLGKVEIGTPVLFDIGVYLVVVGVTLIIILSLAEEE